MRILKYLSPGEESDSAFELRIQQLLLIARALATEIEALQAELAADSSHGRERPLAIDKDGIDFYQEIERYEIELIRSALDQCGGNQTHAATLLRMKSTTLNAKMKHYGLNHVRSIITQQTTRPT